MCLTDVRSLRGARLISGAHEEDAIASSIVLGISRPSGEQEFIEVLQWSEHLPFNYGVLSPSRLELWLLRDAPTSVAESSQSGSSVTQFVHEWTECAPQGSPRTMTRRRRKYDAIRAQRNESLFSGPSTLQVAIDELERTALTQDPTSFAAIDLRRGLSALRKNIDNWTGSIPDENPGWVAGSIDMISGSVSYARKVVDLLDRLLQQRVRPPRDIELGPVVALDAVASFCGMTLAQYEKSSDAEIRWHVVMGERISSAEFPELAGGMTINSAWTSTFAFNVLTFGADNPPSEEIKKSPQVRVVEFPQQFMLRAGSYPLIAQALAVHHVRPFDYRDRFSELESELRDNIDLEVRRFRKRGHKLTHDLNDSVELLAYQLHVDLYAFLLMGPAYVYAMARFDLLGKMGALDWINTGAPSKSFQLELLRLRLNLRLMRTFGIEAPFYTKSFAPVRENLHGKNLAELIGSNRVNLSKRYNFAVTQVSQCLADGQILVDTDPDLLLNALWRAVATRGRYVNEAATFLSIVLSNRRSKAAPGSRG